MGKLGGLGIAKTEKKEPVKAQPSTDKDGGIFTSKVVAIWHRIFGKRNG